MSGIHREFFQPVEKMVGDDPALHGSYVERGHSVVVGSTAKVGHILIGFGRQYSVSRSALSGLKLLPLTRELESFNTK